MKMKSLLYPTLLSLLHWHVAVVSAARLNMASDESALVAMREHFNSLDPNNVLASNWSSSTSVCNWIGVTCGSSHRRVTALNLSYMSLDATIPPHLGNLSFLSGLHLPNNSFHGNLPAELAGLRRLSIINLRFNKFTGSIPSWFESLRKLKHLLLAGNSFTGTVPHFLFNMSSLQSLELFKNKFWGPLPSNIFLSPSLQYLYLTYNQISGAIPSAIINSSFLQVIDLDYNNLSGQLPERIFHHLPNLKELHVTSNALSGEKLLSGDDSITQTMNLATIGYMAPEYGLEGRVSRQGDVYSYGILLMETFTQKKPTDEMFVGEFTIKEWVKMSCPDSLLDIVDAKLLVEEGETDTKRDCLLFIMTLALNCLAESPGERTRMKDAMNALKKIKRLLLN
ncbi:hypothetical protein HN51_063636 [Arachis hypogaea]|uniref:Leucine-rich repeat-containing N-terminal plant-type domain-containing protein n=1 Tax=Arachis hypogaea TaxID=3818 RepID=A0A445AXD9_ARAHY|nr:putative receptor-like protein kinase At3g47110 [Arachis hypogaea]QHO21222.1 LRR receptor-like serine/threonine-protein kinase EFR [Arachis hypogaea]RYR31099.1 hypothetical protein Ahy_B01g055884 [Arachis hypogaea]